jgi:hypothetical protein
VLPDRLFLPRLRQPQGHQLRGLAQRLDDGCFALTALQVTSVTIRVSFKSRNPLLGFDLLRTVSG